MPYAKISDYTDKLTNPQRSDQFLKAFKDAVREGQFDATYLGNTRFTLPKRYTRRGSEDTYSRSAREMVFEATPAFEEWFTEQNRELTPTRRGSVIKASLETIEAGLVDFSALAKETRKKMQASHKKGQRLGKSRTNIKKK